MSINQSIYHIDKISNKNHTIISADTEKAFEKNLQLFMIKLSTKWAYKEYTSKQ